MHDLLRRLISEGAAQFFADACEISQRRPPFRSTTHLVGHLLREVESAMRDVLVTLPKAHEHLTANPPKNKSATHAAEIDAILHGLDLAADDRARAWRSFTGKDGSWSADAHRDDLRFPRAADSAFSTRLDLFVEVLRTVLDRAESRYTDVIARLEIVCARSSPSDADIAYVAKHLAPGVTALAHVFQRLSPSWLTRLREHGAFKDPPEIHYFDDGSHSFPWWPQGGYLARIAVELPDDVAETIEGIPCVENEAVHLAFLDAASRMPPKHAARIVRHEAPWLEKHRWGSGALPERVQALRVTLIDGNELDCAVHLLRCVLGLLPMDEERWWRGPEARIGSWAYGELVRANVPALAAAAPVRAFELLYELLDAGSEERSSLRGRPIAGAGYAETHNPFDILLAMLRKLHVARSYASAEALRGAVAELESKGIALYDRLALHLLRTHGRGTPDLVVERAIDQKRIAGAETDDEIALMIRDRFAELIAADQSRVLDALRESSSVQTFRAEFGDRFSSEEHSLYARQRLFRWFHLLGEARPASIAAEYAELLAEFGEPESRMRVTVGRKAPIDAEALASLADEELLTYLRDWIPPSSDRFEASSPDGLGDQIKMCVAKEPARFSRLARAFRGMDAAYVAGLLWGLREAPKGTLEQQHEPIDWGSVLDLLEWTSTKLEQPAEDTAVKWIWPRHMSAKVAEDCIAALARDDDRGTSRAWAVVRTLMSDPNPGPERDADYGKRDDVHGFPLNTVRGQALEAAIGIASALKSTQTPAARGLLAEVLAAIESRADSNTEPNLAIRCVIARHFDYLHDVDSSLAPGLAHELFPTTEDRSDARLVAWRSFVMFNQAYVPVFNLLRESYQATVECLEGMEAELAGTIGTHLTSLVASGAVAPAGDALLEKFVDKAPATVRCEALANVGRAIWKTKESLDGDVLTRLRTFWEWWADRVAQRGEQSDLEAFGWWFASEHFDDAWSLSMLERALAATGGKIDWEQEVMRKLVKLAGQFPGAVATCLGRLIDAPDEWWVARNQNAVRSALQALHATSAAAIARELASRLVARGQPGFQDLA